MALPRACHGGGDVAAVEHDRGSVAREKGLQHGWSGARGLRGCRVWRWSSKRWPPGLPKRRRRHSAPAAKETEREEEDDRLDLFANSEKFRGPTVKQK